MFIDFLLALAWLVIVFLPVIVASRQPVVSHNGYLDAYMNSAGGDPATTGTEASSSTEA